MTAGKIYWTDISTDTIERANLDGSEREVLVMGLDDPVGIALDTDPIGVDFSEVLVNPGIWFADTGFNTAVSYVFQMNAATENRIGIRTVFFPQGPSPASHFSWNLNRNVLTLTFASSSATIRLRNYDSALDLLSIDGPPSSADIWGGCRSNPIPANPVIITPEMVAELCP